jgi:hypothetical protein
VNVAHFLEPCRVTIRTLSLEVERAVSAMPFLLFVVVVTAVLVALGYVIYPL